MKGFLTLFELARGRKFRLQVENAGLGSRGVEDAGSGGKRGVW